MGKALFVEIKSVVIFLVVENYRETDILGFEKSLNFGIVFDFRNCNWGCLYFVV